jgi:hypothetical protein
MRAGISHNRAAVPHNLNEARGLAGYPDDSWSCPFPLLICAMGWSMVWRHYITWFEANQWNWSLSRRDATSTMPKAMTSESFGSPWKLVKPIDIGMLYVHPSNQTNSTWSNIKPHAKNYDTKCSENTCSRMAPLYKSLGHLTNMGR